MRYIISSHVVRVEEHFAQIYLGGTGNNAKFENRSLGWFLYLKGSHEALHMGMEKPELTKGDRIKITLEKIDA